MNREEILNKAKNENKDEMEIAVKDKSMWICYSVMCSNFCTCFMYCT